MCISLFVYLSLSIYIYIHVHTYLQLALGHFFASQDFEIIPHILLCGFVVSANLRCNEKHY